MSDEPKTYQPKWEEKKSETHHHHHHHHHYSSKSSNRTNSWGGWLKLRDKQAYYGMMLIVVAVLAFGSYKLVMMFVDELRAMPHGDPSQELKVDELGIKKVDEADALYLGDSLAHELKVDTMVHSVKGVEHNVYRPPRKKTNETIDGREWQDIFKNLRRWFQANGRDPKFIISCILFGLFIIGMIGYAIYKYKHKHSR
jgi:hypothetical protein